jgi:hypothetical protein
VCSNRSWFTFTRARALPARRRTARDRGWARDPPPPRNVLWCKSSDGTEQNQRCSDEGPLTLDRSKTVDEEISAKVVDFIDRNDPKKTSKPFFVQTS